MPALLWWFHQKVVDDKILDTQEVLKLSAVIAQKGF